VAPVFAVVLGFFRSSFTDLALVLQRYQIAGIFPHMITVGASVCAATSSVACESPCGNPASRIQTERPELTIILTCFISFTFHVQIINGDHRGDSYRVQSSFGVLKCERPCLKRESSKCKSHHSECRQQTDLRLVTKRHQGDRDSIHRWLCVQMKQAAGDGSRK